MTPELRQIVLDRDEVALETAYFENECPHFFSVDWRGADDEIVEDCAACLGLDSLKAEWRDEDLFISFEGREVQVPLQSDVADRHITLCSLNDVLSLKYEIRFLVFSHGSDTLGFAALGIADWRELEAASPAVVAENFIDPRQLPNLMTELTDEKLPADARARFERMLKRNERRQLNHGHGRVSARAQRRAEGPGIAPRARSTSSENCTDESRQKPTPREPGWHPLHRPRTAVAESVCPLAGHCGKAPRFEASGRAKPQSCRIGTTAKTERPA